MPDIRPVRPHAHRGERFATLWEAEPDPAEARGGRLPPPLDRYGLSLAIPLRTERPTVVANFVESLDGVVAFDDAVGSGAEVSGYNEPDRFVMGLLRALSDAIVIGAGTIRAAPRHVWTSGRVNRDYAEAYADWRLALGLAPAPTLIVVSGSGRLDPAHPAFHEPDATVIVATTTAGANEARRHLPSSVQIAAVAHDSPIPAEAIVQLAADAGARLLLSEGGPHLMASLTAAVLMDELFVALAPQLLGRGPDQRRRGMIEDVAFPVDAGRWAALRSVRRSADHLFLRYRFPAPNRASGALSANNVNQEAPS